MNIPKPLYNRMKTIPFTSTLIHLKFFQSLSLFNWWNCTANNSKRKKLRLVWSDIQTSVNPVSSMPFSERKKLQSQVCQEKQNISKLWHCQNLWLSAIARAWCSQEFPVLWLRWSWMDCIPLIPLKTLLRPCLSLGWESPKNKLKQRMLFIGKKKKSMTVRRLYRNMPCLKAFTQETVYPTNRSQLDTYWRIMSTVS